MQNPRPNPNPGRNLKESVAAEIQSTKLEIGRHTKELDNHRGQIIALQNRCEALETENSNLRTDLEILRSTFEGWVKQFEDNHQVTSTLEPNVDEKEAVLKTAAAVKDNRMKASSNK